jgi:hypothetical protein
MEEGACLQYNPKDVVCVTVESGGTTTEDLWKKQFEPKQTPKQTPKQMLTPEQVDTAIEVSRKLGISVDNLRRVLCCPPTNLPEEPAKMLKEFREAHPDILKRWGIEVNEVKEVVEEAPEGPAKVKAGEQTPVRRHRGRPTAEEVTARTSPQPKQQELLTDWFQWEEHVRRQLDHDARAERLMLRLQAVNGFNLPLRFNYKDVAWEFGGGGGIIVFVDGAGAGYRSYCPGWDMFEELLTHLETNLRPLLPE